MYNKVQEKYLQKAERLTTWTNPWRSLMKQSRWKHCHHTTADHWDEKINKVIKMSKNTLWGSATTVKAANSQNETMGVQFAYGSVFIPDLATTWLVTASTYDS